MPSYLQYRYKTWYAVLEIPKKLRPVFGKSRFFQSLKTDSQRVAEHRVLPVVANWKRQIELARTGNERPEAIMHQLESITKNSGGWDADEQGNRLKQITPGMVQKWLLSDLIDNQIEETGEVSDALAEAAEVVLNNKFPLNQHLDSWFASLTVEAKTRDLYRNSVLAFCKKFKFAEDVTWKAVADWVEKELMDEKGLSVPTCKREITACRQYWKWLRRHRDLDLPAPFDDVVPIKSNRKATAKKRQDFSVIDYHRLLDGAQRKGDKTLADLIMLGAHTGARIEELCSLKLDDVTDDRFKIEEAKTSAGQREVPIHSAIRDLVKRLEAESDDGFLLSGLTFNKYTRRSNAISKRFGRLKTKLGYGENLVFHSFRKTVAHQLESALVPENVSARILGHEFKTMTYGLYSGGIRFEVLAEALEKVSYD